MSRVLLAGFWFLALGLSQLPAQEPQAPKTIAGVVRDAAGKPVAGAEVWMVTTEMWLFGRIGDEIATKTGDDGRFHFTVPEQWLQSLPQVRQDLGFAAYRDGLSLGAVSLYRESSLPTGPIEIDLSPAESAVLTVVDPDGKPLAGAKVHAAVAICDSLRTTGSAVRLKFPKAEGKPPRTAGGMTVVNQMPVLLPAALVERLSGTTDAQGRATITGVALRQLAGIAIDAEGFGRQRILRSSYGDTDQNPLAKAKLGKLLPVTGRLVGEPADVSGKPLRILGYGNPDPKSQVMIQIHSDAKTDEQGRFSAAVCEGFFYPFFDWDAASPVRPVPPDQIPVKPGAKNHVEIPLQPAVKAFGYVKDAASGRGLAGVRVALFNSTWRGLITTDASGRYEVTLAPGQTMVHAAILADYLSPAEQRPNQPQTISAKSPELKTVLLQKAAVVAGGVVDDAGQPVAGVTVTATYYGYSAVVQFYDLIDLTQTTGADGRFEFRGIDPNAECRVWAGREGAFSRGVTSTKGDRSGLSLAISPKNAVRVSGRVRAVGGLPASKARVEVWRRPWMPEWNEPEPERVAFDQSATLITDDEGRFTSPPLSPTCAYRLSLADPRYEPAHSAWVDASTGKELPPAELLARTLGEHLGIVKGTGGKPLADALVEFRGGLSRVMGRTDAAGKFSLKPAPDGPGLLFVAHEGYRFLGQRIESLGQPLEVRLATVGEPYGQKLQPVPPTASQQERLKLAQQLFDELIQVAGKDLTGDTRLRVLMKWAEVNPAAAVEFVTKKPSLLARNNEAVRYAAANTLLFTSPDDALELIESLGGGHMPALLYVRLAAGLPKESRQRKLELLAEANVKAQAIKESGFRLVALAQVAEGLLDLGEKERGAKLLTDNLETARKLNRSGYDAYLRGTFAEELSQVDLEAALTLVNEITDPFEKTRHLGNIAQEMAGVQPAAAEKIIMSLEPPSAESRRIDQKDDYIAIASYRMAPVDLPRAMRLTEGMKDPFHKAHARGLMAVALSRADAQANGKTSRELMRSSFDALDAAAAKKPAELPVSVGNFGNIGGWLVLHAQQIDPELAAECRWRLLRLLPEAVSTDTQQRWRDVEALSSAAMFLAGIDAPLARELLTRVDGDRLLASQNSSRTWLPAWGLIDPAEALKRAGEISDERMRTTAKTTLLSALAATGATRERLLHYQAGMWRIDVEDIDQ